MDQDQEIDTSSIRSERIRRAIKALPPEARRGLRERGDIVVKQDPYFSRCRLGAVVTGTDPYTYTFAKQEWQLFNYAINDALVGAGFPATAPYDKATRADTNLTTRSETVNNEWVFIDGVALCILPNSDVEVVKRLFPEMYCRLDMMGSTDLIKFGNPIFLGGGPGLFGQGETKLAMPNAFDVAKKHPGFISNGMPDPAGFKRLSDVILWGPKSSSDSNLTFTIELTRQVSWQAAGRAAAATPGVPAYVPPTATAAEGTYADLLVVFDSVQVGSRGRNR